MIEFKNVTKKYKNTKQKLDYFKSSFVFPT